MINYTGKLVIKSKKQRKQLVIASVLITLGAILMLCSYPVLYYTVHHALTIKENSPLFQLWRVNPMPLYLKIHAYNWTNPDDIYKPRVKPKFEEIGPFVFKEVKEKKNVTFHSNKTISFQQYHTFTFDRTLSIGDLSVPINTINLMLSSVAYYATINNFGYFSVKALQIAISQLNATIALMKPFGVYFFEGYDDILFTIVRNIPWLKIKMPSFNKAGWFSKRNGSSWEGHFNMGTSYHNFGVLQSWNYANTTSIYEGSCGNLTGVSAGELYPPYRTKDQIAFFFPDMCRSVSLEFDEEVEVEGILGYKYSLGASFLDNGTLIPDNKCYCQDECFPSGVVNISRCQYGAPAFASLPHFYQADDFYTRAIEVKLPQKEKDEFYIIIEPYTGIPLHVTARLQLNLLLQPLKHLSIYDRIPRVMFPIFWFEEVATIPLYLITILKLILYIPSVLHLIGIVITITGLYLTIQIFFCYTIKYQQILHTVRAQFDIL